MEAEETEMSNAPDDSGHRPPMPRQSDPQPYPGDPSPYHGDPSQHQGGDPSQSGYAPPPPPPNHPLPPGPWQGPPGYGPPPQGRQVPNQHTKGMLGHLFDFSFDHMVTPQLIKGAYFFSVIFTTMVAAVWLIIGIWLFQYGYLLTILIVLFTPPMWFGSLMAIRMTLEFLINQFKLTEHLKAIREREGLR